MTTALAHRGPDGDTDWHDPNKQLYLGHRRLAILDIVDGNQPMWNREKTICVVYNGEIYNHKELRAELVALGFHFQTSGSDTEVLIHGYAAWGEDLPNRLNGMFAFAIYDARRDALFLARDRFGEKPLYIASGPEGFAFASELTALAHLPWVNQTIDPEGLTELLAYGFILQDRSLWSGVRKVPSGHIVWLELATNSMSIRRFWQFTLTPNSDWNKRSEEDLLDELEHLVDQAVARRLISDVPLGVFLSGGIDSSLILSSVVKAQGAAITPTFTIGFDEPSFDESAYAEIVARHFGSLHFKKTLTIEAAKSMLAPVLGQMDEPLGDPSILPTYLVAKFAREHVTVALSGDGADELFAGYDPFKALKLAKLYSGLIPRPIHKFVRALAEKLPRSGANMSMDFKIRRTLMGLSYSADCRMPAWMSPLEPDQIASLLQLPVTAQTAYAKAIDLYRENSDFADVDQALMYFTRFYLTDNILMKSDRASMMNGLEARAVFLDNDLVDFAQKLPHRFKYRNGTTKYLLRKLAARRLPETIVKRRKKGFGIPVNDWLKTFPAPAPLDAQTGCDPALVSSYFEAHVTGRHDFRLFLWVWLTLNHWANRPNIFVH